jgi:hypothetical protein
MKSIITLLLSATSLLAADDISVRTTTKTNAPYGTVTTKEYLTRAGQTNLLRSTTRYSQSGLLKSCSHFVYYRGQRVAWHISSPPHGYTLSQSDAGFSVGFETKSNVLTEITLSDKEGNLLDWFVTTNDVLTPVASSELRKYTGKPRVNEGDDK